MTARSPTVSTMAPFEVETGGPAFRRVKSAERTLALFEYFSLQQRALSIGELSRALDVPQPSVSMIVRNLCRLGYLEHDPSSRTYSPTIRIMLLGSWIHRRFSQEQEIERRLDDLRRESGETVFLAIRNGVFSQYVLVQLAEEPNRLEVQSGMLRPIVKTAAGRALLSLSSDAEVEMVARRWNAEAPTADLRVRPVRKQIAGDK